MVGSAVARPGRDSRGRLMVRMLAALALIAMLPGPAPAQTVDSILASPKAVRLRRIWAREGPADLQENYGMQVVALPGVGPGPGCAFGVMCGYPDRRWRIYHLDSNGTAKLLDVRQDSSVEDLWFEGRFLGDGSRTLVTTNRRLDTVTNETPHILDFHLIDSGRIKSTPMFRWYADSVGEGMSVLQAPNACAADLDLDGADELIVNAPSAITSEHALMAGSVWIYAGGPNFQVRTPASIIRTGYFDRPGYRIYPAHLDNDPYPELVIIGPDADIWILWGTGSIPDSSAQWQRISRPGYDVYNQLFRIDGDSLDDIVSTYVANGTTGITRFFLSNVGKNMRTRSYAESDADVVLSTLPAYPVRVGALADSNSIQEMIGINGKYSTTPEFLHALGGSARGIDRYYDAYDEMDRFFFDKTAYADFDNDGWVDVLDGAAGYGDFRGLAQIYAGGPYIPRDTITTGVIEDLASEGHVRAISVWPNPATDEVNIAWRGDLARMPSRIEVVDELGRRIDAPASFEGNGLLRWNCRGASRGAYFVQILDQHGDLLASVRIVLR